MFILDHLLLVYLYNPKNFPVEEILFQIQSFAGSVSSVIKDCFCLFEMSEYRVVAIGIKY